MLIKNATIEELIKEIQERMECGVISGRIKNGAESIEVERIWGDKPYKGIKD